METNLKLPDIKAVFPYFSALNKQQYAEALRSVKHIELRRGSVYFEDDPLTVSSKYIISGELRCYAVTPEGKEITLYRLRKGDRSSYLEAELSGDPDFSITLQAEKACSLLVIDSAASKRLCSICPEAKRFETGLFIKRCAGIINSLESMLSFDPRKRLAKFLLAEKACSGSNKVMFSHDQIGRYVGSPREVVTRSIRVLESRGILRHERCLIEILNQSALEEISEF